MTESQRQLLDELLVDWEVLAEQGRDVDLRALCESRGAPSLHSELRRRAEALQDLARRFGRGRESSSIFDVPLAASRAGRGEDDSEFDDDADAETETGSAGNFGARSKSGSSSFEIAIGGAEGSEAGLESGPSADDDPQATAITVRDLENGGAMGPMASGPPPEIPGYRILGEVGRGGMGVVYLAEQLAPRRTVALKTLSAGADAKPDDLIRFLAEAEILAKVQHPNIIQIYEIKSWNGLTYICMEYAKEGDLARRAARSPMTPRETAKLAVLLASAAHAMHLEGILHRDLKPSNVLFVGDSPRIADFGLASAINQNLGHFDPDQFLGTPSYIAPEQALGRPDQLGPACDVYGLGTILYEALTGQPPFQGETPVDTILQVLREPAPAPSKTNSQIPLDLDVICRKCLEKDPKNRYESALELADDLERFLQGRPIRARRSSWTERMRKWMERRPEVAMLGAMLFAVSAIGGYSAFRLWLHEQDRIAAHQAEEQRRQQFRYAIDLQQARADLLAGRRDLARRRLALCPELCRGWEHSYLTAMAAEGPRDPAIDSNDAASQDARLRWRGGEELTEPGKISTARPWSAAGDDRRPLLLYSPRGRFLAASRRDGGIDVWSVVNRSRIWGQGQGQGLAAKPVLAAAFDPSDPSDQRLWLAVGSAPDPSGPDPAPSCRLIAVNLPQGTIAQEFAAPFPVRRLDFLSQGSQDEGSESAPLAVIAGGDRRDGFAALLDLSGRSVWRVALPGAFCDLAVLNDGGFVSASAAASGAGELELWRSPSGLPAEKPTRRPFPLDAPASALRMASSGGSFAAVDERGRVWTWDGLASSASLTLRGGSPLDLAFSPDGSRLALALDNGDIQVWDHDSDCLLLTLHAYSDPVVRIVFSPDGGSLATLSSGEYIKIWR